MAKKKHIKTVDRQSSKSKRSSKQVDFATEYKYVVGDLKQIGVLAAALFGLLVVLSIFI